MTKKLLHPENNEWTNVYFDSTNQPLYALEKWCEENCKGKVYFANNWGSINWSTMKYDKNMDKVANFVYPEDATLFTIKWL